MNLTNEQRDFLTEIVEKAKATAAKRATKLESGTARRYAMNEERIASDILVMLAEESAE